MVLRDVAVSIAGGAQNLSGGAVSGSGPFSGGSPPPDDVAVAERVDNAGLARVTMVVTRSGTGVGADRGPPRRDPTLATCYGDVGEVIVIRIDATLTECYSDKECAAGTFKGGYGIVRSPPGVTSGERRRLSHARATPAPTPPPITSRSSTPRSPPSRGGGARIRLSPSTAPAPATPCSTPHQTEQPARRVGGLLVGFDLDTRADTAIGQMPAAGGPALDPAGTAARTHRSPTDRAAAPQRRR